MEFYIDGEFDAVYAHGSHVQCLISIGIVAYADGKQRDTYYSLIRPRRFHKLSRVVQKMTQLRNGEIHQARSLSTVIQEAAQFIQSSCGNSDCRLYSFGPDDARTLRNHAEFEAVSLPDVFAEIIDLQHVLSQQITWNGTMISSTLSLDDLKFVYGIHGAVIHNALNDAIDLMQIHEAARQKRMSPARIHALGKQKEQHRQEIKQRNYEKMLKILHERYGKYVGQQRRMIFYPDVIQQLLFMKDSLNDILITETGIIIDDQLYPYERLHANMAWSEQEALEVTLSFSVDTGEKTVILPLTYRNGAHFESIWQMIEDSKGTCGTQFQKESN